MKKNVLAIILALCMVISMLPATVFAAHDGDRLTRQLIPTSVGKLEGATVQPNASSYTVSLSGSGNGYTELLVDSPAQVGSEVYFVADPDDGYLAEIYFEGLEAEDFVYLGMDMWGFIMPANKVTLQIEYVEAEGPEYHIATYDCGGGGRKELSRRDAKQYESVLLAVDPEHEYDFDPETLIWSFGADLYYLFEDSGIYYYEIIMGAQDVKILVGYSVRSAYEIDNELFLMNGDITTDRQYAVVGTEVLVHVTPAPGYRAENVTARTDDGGIYLDLEYRGEENGSQVYSFLMPPSDVTMDADFVAKSHPVSVTVDTGLGGTATLSHTEAQAGDTVTLTCKPQEGYRVAQITGAKVTDHGDNTYSFIMPDAAVALHVLFLRENNPFLDINETQFFHDPVLWAAENGITNGIDPTHFGPAAPCSRAQVVTMLWRWAGSPEPTSDVNPFTDVPAGSWYEAPVLWAVEQGITNGLSENTFGPAANCNRGQVVTFLYRYLNANIPADAVNPFVDVPAGSWVEAPVLWALANGVTTGADATHFNPNGQCLRAYFVTFLYRAKDIPMAYPLHWVINGFQDTPSDWGTVTLSHTSAQAGETITATVIPAEGNVIDWVKCENGSPVTKVSETEYTFVMPEGEEIFHVNFVKAPTEPEPTDPTDPTEPEEPTDPEDPPKPTQPYELVLKANGPGYIAYLDKDKALPGESIFFKAVPNPGCYMSNVTILDPYNEIDEENLKIFHHDNHEVYGEDVYEIIMIDHQIVLTCHFRPIGS